MHYISSIFCYIDTYSVHVIPIPFPDPGRPINLLKFNLEKGDLTELILIWLKYKKLTLYTDKFVHMRLQILDLH